MTDMTTSPVILAKDKTTTPYTEYASWSELSTEVVQTNSRSRNTPAPRAKSHLPATHENRTDAVESIGPRMRITWDRQPRSKNPAHQHLLTQESTEGARGIMYLLNHVSRMFDAPDYEHLYWADLNTSTINTIMGALRDKGYKASTRNSYLTALKSCAREAWMLKQMDLETYERIKLIKRIKQPKEPTGSAHELSLLMDLVHYIDNVELRPTKNRDALILLVMIFTGMRRKELTQLQYPVDLYYSKSEIHIRGKGNKIRFAQLPEPIWERLIKYIKEERGTDIGAIFCPYWNKRNQPKISERGIDVSTVNRILERIIKGFIAYRDADSPGEKLKVTPHDIRRSFATIMNDRGIPLSEVQHLLGHAMMQTTQTYVRDDKDAYRQHAASLGEELIEEYTKNRKP